MPGAVSTALEGTVDFGVYALKDGAKRWFARRFKWLSPIYGCMDGPLDEQIVDEIYYIAPARRGESTDVLCRGYKDSHKHIDKKIQDYMSGGMSLDDCLATEAGSFTNMDGDVISDYNTLFDDDFERYNSEKWFDRPQKLMEKDRVRQELVDDMLRFCSRDATYVGLYKGRDVRVSRPNKYPIKQVFYFGGQAIASKLYYKFYNWIGGIFGVPNMDQMRKGRYEAFWTDRYKRATQTLNDILGLPRLIDVQKSLD